MYIDKIKKGKAMTVRELIQMLILEAPDLGADVYINSGYINSGLDETEIRNHRILSISSQGSNDSLIIEITG